MRFRDISIIMLATGLCACGSSSGGDSSVPAYSTTTSTASAPSGNAVTTTSLASTEAGKNLFQSKCASCHGLNGDARNNNAANLQFTRLDSLSIAQTIINGKGTMPPFKGALADSDIAHLAIYVKSIRQ